MAQEKKQPSLSCHLRSCSTCHSTSPPRVTVIAANQAEVQSTSRVNHILWVHGHNPGGEKRCSVHDEIGQRSLERPFPVLTEDSTTQATHSAGQSRLGFKRARDIAAPAHPGALIEANPRIQGVIRDAVWAGHLLGRSWRRSCLRSSRQPPPPISAHLTLMSKPRQSFMFRRQPRQQTKLGSKQLEDCRDRASQTGEHRIP